MKQKRHIDADRRKLIDRANDMLREIEIDFNTAAHWNNTVRKLDEAEIDYDPDGKIRKMYDGIAEMLCRESSHKIPRAQWLTDIQKIAVEKFQFSTDAKVDWGQYANDYYLDCTPEEAMREDMSNA